MEIQYDTLLLQPFCVLYCGDTVFMHPVPTFSNLLAHVSINRKNLNNTIYYRQLLLAIFNIKKSSEFYEFMERLKLVFAGPSCITASCDDIPIYSHVL
jgi:hypothetical protein